MKRTIDIIRKLTERRIFKALFTLILITVAYTIVLIDSDLTFQRDSEGLVTLPMIGTAHDLNNYDGVYGLGHLLPNNSVYNNAIQSDYWLLLDLDPELNLYEYYTDTYDSQIGLQGHFFSLIVRLLPNKDISDIIIVLRMICSLLFVITAFLIAVQLKKKYGYMYAFSFWFVVCTSGWTHNFAPNLYWVMFTWFVPMLLGLICLNYERLRKFIYPLFFISIVIKSLCGYEYLSTIMISSEVFLAAEFFVNKETRSTVFKCIVISGLCMLAGFFTVAIFHSYYLGNGDLSEGIKTFMYQLVGRRTYADPLDYGREYSASLSSSVWFVIIRYLFCGYGDQCSLMMFLTLLLMAFHYKINRRFYKLQIILLLLNFSSVLSWIVLAKAHSYVHTHMNFVLFDLGCSQCNLYCVLFLIGEFFQLTVVETDECKGVEILFLKHYNLKIVKNKENRLRLRIERQV